MSLLGMIDFTDRQIGEQSNHRPAAGCDRYILQAELGWANKFECQTHKDTLLGSCLARDYNAKPKPIYQIDPPDTAF
jgi:hypothetical protein